MKRRSFIQALGALAVLPLALRGKSTTSAAPIVQQAQEPCLPVSGELRSYANGRTVMRCRAGASLWPGMFVFLLHRHGDYWAFPADGPTDKFTLGVVCSAAKSPDPCDVMFNGPIMLAPTPQPIT